MLCTMRALAILPIIIMIAFERLKLFSSMSILFPASVLCNLIFLIETQNTCHRLMYAYANCKSDFVKPKLQVGYNVTEGQLCRYLHKKVNKRVIF